MSQQREYSEDGRVCGAPLPAQSSDDNPRLFVYDVETSALGSTATLRSMIRVIAIAVAAAIWFANVIGFVRALRGGALVSLTLLAASPLLFLAALLLIRRGRVLMGDKRLQAEPLPTGVASVLRQFAESGEVAVFSREGRLLAKRAANRGLRGYAFRISAGASCEPIQPLSFPIEPILLDQSMGPIEELAAARDKPLDSESPPARRGAAVGESKWGAIFRAHEWSILISISGLIALYFMITSPGRNAVEAISPLIGSAAWLTFRIASRLSRCQWFAVSGGVLLRGVRGLGTRSQLHLMRREDTLILATRRWNAAFWNVTVADTTVVDLRRMTDVELTLLLRAWSSPIQPPPLELLSEMVEA